MSKKVLIAAAVLAAGAAVVGGVALYSLQGSSVQTRSLETYSAVYTVDREYRSMMGPSSTQEIELPEFDPPELLWITGYSAEVVHADGSPAPQEFMCHANLNFDADRHARLFDLPIHHTGRLFTLSQGQQEIQLPDGFGLPFYSDESFELTTQVLNLNPGGEATDVRHKVTLNYVLDRDTLAPMKPLFMTSGWGLKLIEGDAGYFNVSNPDVEQHGEGCLPGEAAGPDVYKDDFARTFAGHWVVEPGREVNRTLVTNIMKLPYDTTVHYIAAHLHPFAESVELRDLSTGETVYKSEVKNYGDKIGLERVEYFSSEEGIPVYKDHEYELISSYNNTTQENQDSMAVMLFYLRDKKFRRTPRLFARVRHVDQPAKLGEERLVLQTNKGEIRIGLYPQAAPEHVEQLLKLARLGVFDGVIFHRVEKDYLIQTAYPHTRVGEPLTPEQSAAIRPIPAEFTDLTHEKGVVAMALNDNADPDSAEASFFILLKDSPHLDQQFTIIGRLHGGIDVVQRISRVKTKDGRPVDPVVVEKALVMDPVQLTEYLAQQRRAAR